MSGAGPRLGVSPLTGFVLSQANWLLAAAPRLPTRPGSGLGFLIHLQATEQRTAFPQKSNYSSDFTADRDDEGDSGGQAGARPGPGRGQPPGTAAVPSCTHTFNKPRCWSVCLW